MRSQASRYVVILSLLGAGCAVAGEPGHRAVSLDWSNGSVAPRYFYHSQITIPEAGRSQISIEMGTPPVVPERLVWKFDPEPGQQATLWAFIQRQPLEFESTPAKSTATPEHAAAGDGQCILNLLAHRRRHPVPCAGDSARQLTTMMRAMVPAPIAMQIDAAKAKFAAAAMTPPQTNTP